VLTKLRSIKTKATLIVTVCVVALLVLVSALEMHRLKADFREVLGTQQMSLVSRMADHIDDSLKSAHGVLIAVSKEVPLEIVNDATQLKKSLEGQTGLRMMFDNLLVFSRTGMTRGMREILGETGTACASRIFAMLSRARRRASIFLRPPPASADTSIHATFRTAATTAPWSDSTSSRATSPRSPKAAPSSSARPDTTTSPAFRTATGSTIASIRPSRAPGGTASCLRAST
jgi:hypothetical protein